MSATTDLTRRQQLVSGLADKEYRDAFVADQIRIGVPLQIRAMRDERNWIQEALGERMNPPMLQESVWRLENPNKANLTIGTLLRVASAFDVALMVRFVPFSELIDSTPWLSEKTRSIPEYSKDTDLHSHDAKMDEPVPTPTDDWVSARVDTNVLDGRNRFGMNPVADAA